MNFKKLFANTLAPPLCIFCGKELYITSKYCVCGKCALNLPYNDKNRCSICSTPLDISYGDLYCTHCKKTNRIFAQNISRYIYKEGVAAAIKKMKFGKNQTWIAKALGDFLTQTVEEDYSGIAFDMVTYVPLSRKGLRERGFNQSEIIAETVCTNTGFRIGKSILLKPLNIPKQSGLDFKSRRQNVKGAFKISNGDDVADKTILLIDDIFTTGATLNECAKVLKRAGACVVYCATAAATPSHK